MSHIPSTYYISLSARAREREVRLDSDHVTRWLTLGANLGVLVGILLLVVEMFGVRVKTL